MEEFASRGFKDFSNKDLVGALNAIGSAWSRFNTPAKKEGGSESPNRLRTVILQQIENQTVNTGNDAPPVSSPEPVIEVNGLKPAEEF